MLFTQATGYAVTSLTYIAARPDQLSSCSSICNAAKLPERFVLQVLRKLVDAGILTSTRGVKGGYRLAKPANQVTLQDVVDAVNGPTLAGEAGQIVALTSSGSAAVAKTLASIDSDIRKRLSSVTIADLKLAKRL